jgi:hypothetical protein
MELRYKEWLEDFSDGYWELYATIITAGVGFFAKRWD